MTAVNSPLYKSPFGKKSSKICNRLHKHMSHECNRMHYSPASPVLSLVRAGHGTYCSLFGGSCFPLSSWSTLFCLFLNFSSSYCLMHSGMPTYSMGTSSASSAKLKTYLIFWLNFELINGRVTARSVRINQEGCTMIRDLRFFLNRLSICW